MRVSVDGMRLGSSPRRRGAHIPVRPFPRLPRIIPAQAGSTPSRRPSCARREDHPRAGGEHVSNPLASRNTTGSSPRRRGAPHPSRLQPPGGRIVPAQAGSTSSTHRGFPSHGDHPRAGAEHSWSGLVSRLTNGSSPRRRGARGRRHPRHRPARIIPAQAGSTVGRGSPRGSRPDHPRAGGEHATGAASAQVVIGSSPRRRGARRLVDIGNVDPGIIPAQAGSTTPCRYRQCRSGDHPRAGGEHLYQVEFEETVSGSSPRRRGAGEYAVTRADAPGIIPAQAGSTGKPVPQ